MKKIQVLLMKIFNPFFKGSKVICQRGKTFFFHQKSEGIAFTFCRYLNQNMRAFKFCRYCLQKYFLIPSNFDEKKYHCILRAIPWEFWDEVFSLKIWGHVIQQCSQNVGQYTFCSEYYVLQLQSVLMIFKVSTGKIGILHMSYIDRCSIFVYQ